MQSLPNRDDYFFPIEVTFNKFFDDFFSNKNSLLNSTKANTNYPKLNYYSDGKTISMHIAVPGVTKENLEVEWHEDFTLTIRGKMSKEYSSPETSKFYLRELRTSSFSRNIACPGPESGVNKPPSLSLKDGILAITWEIEPEKPKEKVLLTIK